MIRRALALALALAPTIAAAQPGPSAPVRYVVRPGDTCVRIARHHYGDSRATVFIHAANPDMGPTPHRLRPGTTLTLPPRRTGAAAPDALLTAVHNRVEVQAPAPRPGRANDALYRGMRVNTEERSTAEVTFADETQLQLAERTLVVILGETSSRVQRSASARDTVLERGTLTAFLARVDAQRGAQPAPPSVSTAAGRVTLERSPDGAQARLEVDEARRTTVSVYRGASRVESPARQRVRVPQGYGVRAAQGQRIPAPRPLPLAPVWERAPSPVILADRDSVTLTGEYRAGTPAAAPDAPAAPAPASWRVEVARDPRFNELVADEVGAAARTRLEIPDVAPGSYHVRVSAIDAERFQGPPGEAARVTVTRVTVAPAAAPGPGRRATVTVGDGLFCGLDGASLAAVAAPFEVDRLSAHTLRCAATAQGEGTAEYAIAAERLGPLRATLRLDDVDPRARRATGRVRVVDGAGAPVARDGLVVEAVGEGVTVGAAAPVGAAEPGVYAVPVSWETGAPAAALRVRVDAESAESDVVTLPAAVVDAPPPARERWFHRLSLRLEGGAGYMLSAFQSNTDRNDPRFGGSAPSLSVGFGGHWVLGVALLRPRGGHGGPALTLQAAGSYFTFPEPAGSTLTGGYAGYGMAGGGLRFEPFSWRVRPFVDAHGAAVFTGPFVLPGFDVGVGVDVPLGRAVLLGAYARYLHVVDDGPSVANEDARVIAGGLALTVRPPSPAE